MEKYSIDDPRRYGDPDNIKAVEDDEDLKYRKSMNDKYEEFLNLLLTFLEDTYYQERSDDDTIRRFVEEMDGGSIKDTIKEGREVLALKPFPHDWIGSVMNAGWKTDNACKKWVTWMLEALEKEGKRVGKLSL